MLRFVLLLRGPLSVRLKGRHRRGSAPMFIRVRERNCIQEMWRWRDAVVWRSAVPHGMSAIGPSSLSYSSNGEDVSYPQGPQSCRTARPGTNSSLFPLSPSASLSYGDKGRTQGSTGGQATAHCATHRRDRGAESCLPRQHRSAAHINKIMN